ncbi:MBL fold metallo-hydrolase [Aquimonas sp.]|uniref:MBL fold metallo-hydrolase n=1 Tax=Aquimonas sp. TaxID=1872588 RepID=UPI0037BE8716
MDRSTELYLREDVYFEPLFNHWFAWPYLIPPVTAARHMVNTHRRIMTSFVNNYQLHIMAVNEPGMAGAEFLNCTQEQVADIRRLIDEIDSHHADMVELSNAVKELDDILRAHSSGETIEKLYEKVPSPLKGYVEIFMDMYHNASYRLLEGLLYRSKFYKPSLQSVSFGMLSKVKERPFALSTPRLPDENHLQFDAHYNAPELDELFKLRDRPADAATIERLFKPYALRGGLDYQDMFTADAPRKRHQPVATGVRVQYIGHAGFMVETNEVTLLVDPVIASRGSDNFDDVLSFSELPPKIDFICLTHNHQDHVSFETLLQLRYKTDTIVVPKNNGGSLSDPSLRMMLRQFNFHVVEVDDMDEVHIAGGRIVSLPFLGEHGDLNVRSKTAWLVELHGKKIFFGADSSNLDPHMYRHIHAISGDIDLLAIGMECVGAPYTWLYGALTTKLVTKKIKDSRRLNGADFEQAAHMVETFRPKQVCIYALGMEPWYNYFMGIEYSDDSKQITESKKLLDLCLERGIPAERMYAYRRFELV